MTRHTPGRVRAPIEPPPDRSQTAAQATAAGDMFAAYARELFGERTGEQTARLVAILDGTTAPTTLDIGALWTVYRRGVARLADGDESAAHVIDFGNWLAGEGLYLRPCQWADDWPGTPFGPPPATPTG